MALVDLCNYLTASHILLSCKMLAVVMQSNKHVVLKLLFNYEGFVICVLQ